MKTRAERRADFFALVQRVGAQDGFLDRAVRRAATDRRVEAIPTELKALAERIRERAVSVTDEHVAEAKRAGYDDDALYELTVSTALGESARRFRKVLDLLGR
jgi:alkylhydroperoxidase family enzyme